MTHSSTTIGKVAADPLISKPGFPHLQNELIWEVECPVQCLAYSRPLPMLVLFPPASEIQLLRPIRTNWFSNSRGVWSINIQTLLESFDEEFLSDFVKKNYPIPFQPCTRAFPTSPPERQVMLYCRASHIVAAGPASALVRNANSWGPIQTYWIRKSGIGAVQSVLQAVWDWPSGLRKHNFMLTEVPDTK